MVGRKTPRTLELDARRRAFLEVQAVTRAALAEPVALHVQHNAATALEGQTVSTVPRLVGNLDLQNEIRYPSRPAAYRGAR